MCHTRWYSVLTNQAYNGVAGDLYISSRLFVVLEATLDHATLSMETSCQIEAEVNTTDGFCNFPSPFRLET